MRRVAAADTPEHRRALFELLLSSTLLAVMPDVATLLDHARREAEAGETFLEFRLDFLDNPCTGAQAIAEFLEQFPESIVLATCRRHQNHGKFNGSIEEQFAILDDAEQSVRGRIGNGAQPCSAPADDSRRRSTDLRSRKLNFELLALRLHQKQIGFRKLQPILLCSEPRASRAECGIALVKGCLARDA